MKNKLLILAFAILISMGSFSCIASAETNSDIDIVALLKEMPYEQRMVVIEDIFQAVADMNGIDALERIYNTVKSNYPTASTSTDTSSTNVSTLEDLEKLLAEQPLAVTKTEYLQGSEQWKSLYPDMLSAILVNNSNDDIKSAIVAFAAWDKNGLPVKIEGQFDFMGGNYIKRVNYDDINLVPGDTFGKDKGFSLSEKISISTFKAVVVSYEAFDGKIWENPYFESFCDMYEGKKITN